MINDKHNIKRNDKEKGNSKGKFTSVSTLDLVVFNK